MAKVSDEKKKIQEKEDWEIIAKLRNSAPIGDLFYGLYKVEIWLIKAI